jgi:hypothetical protein
VHQSTAKHDNEEEQHSDAESGESTDSEVAIGEDDTPATQADQLQQQAEMEAAAAAAEAEASAAIAYAEETMRARAQQMAAAAESNEEEDRIMWVDLVEAIHNSVAELQKHPSNFKIEF